MDASPSGLRARIPLALTLFRLALAPGLLLLGRDPDSRLLFGVCLVGALLSDVFDGILARRLGVSTPGLRRLDSLTDTVFYLAASLAIWRLSPDVIREHAQALWLLLALELGRYAFDAWKFRREASYHMWSSKLWGLALFLAFFSVLALGRNDATVDGAIWLGIVADCEGLAISLVMPRWQSDVPSLFHAWRLRSASAPR